MKSIYEIPKAIMMQLIEKDIISASQNPDIPKNEGGDDLEWD